MTLAAIYMIDEAQGRRDLFPDVSVMLDAAEQGDSRQADEILGQLETQLPDYPINQSPLQGWVYAVLDGRIKRHDAEQYVDLVVLGWRPVPFGELPSSAQTVWEDEVQWDEHDFQHSAYRDTWFPRTIWCSDGRVAAAYNESVGLYGHPPEMVMLYDSRGWHGTMDFGDSAGHRGPDTEAASRYLRACFPTLMAERWGWD